MANTSEAKRRASFARAERLRREREATGQIQEKRPARQSQTPEKMRSAFPSSQRIGAIKERTEAIKAHLRDRERSLLSVAKSDQRREYIKEMFAGYHRLANRDQHYRLEREKKRDQQAKEQTRKMDDQRKAAPRPEQTRKEQDRSKEQEQRRQAAQAAIRRGQELNRQQQQKLDQRRRDEMRKGFNRRAENQKTLERREAEQKRQQMLKELAAKAKAAVEQDQKRRHADQQAAERRQTDEMRNRHRRERDTFRDQENTVLNCHAAAIRRLDASEGRERDTFEAKRNGLVGRAARLLPGSGKKAEQAREVIQQRFEKERMQEHRKLEAQKERIFENQQAARIKHGKERLEIAQAHQGERNQFQQQQERDKPRQIEQRQKAMVQAQEREQTREREQAQERDRVKDGNRTAPRELTPEFSRQR